MKKIFFYAVILTVCFTSCNKEEFIENNELAPEEAPSLAKVYSADVDANTLRPFATALYDALKESPRLREIIKTESLKKFNKEYDVLYQFIKDEWVEDGLTVRQLLLKHFEDEAILANIEASHPTLTIFVPQLPENSFSAEIWNTMEQVPAVAIHSTKQAHTPIIADYGFFDENSNEFILQAGHIPAFPVVVIKDNARVVVAKNGETRSPALASKKGNFAFEFIDEFFDGSKAISTQSGFSYDPDPRDKIDQKLIDAYTMYQNFDGWQRDYIYYGLAPTSPDPSPANAQTTSGRSFKLINDDPSLLEPTGILSRDLKETILSFRFSYYTAPAQMLWYLSNHGNDPVLKPVSSTIAYPWTTGNYSFCVNILAATIGTNVVTQYFTASPDELFEVGFKRESFLVYIPEVTGYKTINLNTRLMVWDLKIYAPEMKISIAKQNPDQTITTTHSVVTEFAGNIGGDFKFGLKFGASAKETTTASYQTATRLTNTNLGDVLINFGDKVILNHSSSGRFGDIINYSLREYSNDMFVITTAPIREQ